MVGERSLAWPWHTAPGWARTRTGGVLLAVVLTASAAQVAFPVPGSPVPVTLQTLAVVLSGVFLGPRLGAAAQAMYLAAGAVGVPVFAAGGAGLAYLLGPTGGYLVAFPAAAAVAGFLFAGGRGGPVRALAALAGGTVIVFVGGVSQLLVSTGLDLRAALLIGVVPFLPGALIKLGIGYWLVRGRSA